MTAKGERYKAMQSGEVTYFTGRPCKYGHITDRWTVNARCQGCHYEEKPKRKIPTESEKKERDKARAQEWYIKNRELTIRRAAIWKSENPDSVYETHKKFMKTPNGKATAFMRNCIRRCLKNKTDRTHKLLGYNREELVSYIDGLFQEGMTWDNHGEWHIDHIVPLSWFLRSGVNDPRVINKLNNLRPLWASENQRRNRKF